MNTQNEIEKTIKEFEKLMAVYNQNPTEKGFINACQEIYGEEK